MPDLAPLLDDAAIRQEATDLLCALLRIDTSNPPGRETPAAIELARYLEAAGVDCELVARNPDRANLIARIEGTVDGPSLCFLGHTDVVPAPDVSDWAQPATRRARDRARGRASTRPAVPSPFARARVAGREVPSRSRGVLDRRARPFRAVSARGG